MKFTKNIFRTIIIATILTSGVASGESLTSHSGKINHSFTGEDGITFINIAESPKLTIIANYDETDSAIVQIVDNAKRLNKKITVSLESGSNKIVYAE